MKTKKQMIDYLVSHFRYDTMNSWNGSTSWAANVKIHNVIPSNLQDKAYELIETDGFYDRINDILSDYSYQNNHSLQAGFNGRSSGYIVMYEGYVETKTIFNFDSKTCNSYNNRDYADGYGWLDVDEAKKRGLYQKQIKKIHTYPGRSIDNYDIEDYNEMLTGEVKAIYGRVREFDKMIKQVINETIDMCKNEEVEEIEYFERKTKKVIA